MTDTPHPASAHASAPAAPGPSPRPRWAARRLGALAPWGALLAMQALFELPSTLRPDGVDPGAARPTVELALLLALYGASFELPRRGRWLRVGLGAIAALLVLIRLDHALFYALMRASPLFYDQLFMLRHLFVLLGDLWGPRTAALLAATAVGAALAVWVVRRLLRVFRCAFQAPRRRRTWIALALYTGALSLAASVGSEAPLARWATPDLVDNVQRSIATYRRIQRGIRRSPYRDYDRVRLTRRPTIQLFIVESYGRVMAAHPVLRDAWLARLGDMERALGERGWSMASAFSRAPVSGGRSWLSEASMLLGTSVIYEAEFQHLMSEGERVQSLPRLLERLGYTTVLLAPADRRRRGVEDVNRYDFDHYVRFEDLDYHGPRMGWGLVPDQYSLRHTDAHVLSSIEGPLFFDFHMVSSHAPWEVVPSYAARWQDLGGGGIGTPDDPRTGELEKRLKRYARTRPRSHYMGRLTWVLRARYDRAIEYSLHVIDKYLREQDGDRLAIVIGDHQPPVVAEEAESFDVPVHLLARDPALLAEFLDHGFTPGLVVDPDARSRLRHEGLLSLLVRALLRADGQRRLPPYLPRGFEAEATP